MFLATLASPAPGATTATVATSTATATASWRPETPQGRLVILESASPSDTEKLHALLASNPEPGQRIALDTVPHTVSAISPTDRRLASTLRRPPAPAVEVTAADVARDLGLSPDKLPAAILTTPAGEVRGIWTAPLDATVSGQILATMKSSSPHGVRVFPPPLPLPARAIAPSSGEALSARHAPARWLTLGTWAAPAGLSLWGVDYEREVRPHPGEPQVVTYWDSSWHARWEERAASADGGIVIEKLARDFTWPKGSAYAHLYIASPAPAEITLNFTQTGPEVHGWLNGRPLDWRRDPARREITVEERGVSDQGNVVTIRRTEGGSAHDARLRLDAGWNRLLVKLVMRHRKEETFAFTARFSAADAAVLTRLRTSTADPSRTDISRQVAARFIPRVFTNAPFNLVYPGSPLALDVDIGAADLLGGTVAPFLPQPAGRLELTVTDYDGGEVLRRSLPFVLPGRASFDLGPAPARGYYATHLRLFDSAGNLVHVYPPDGFSVIGGTAAQRSRKAVKKMAVNYYYMGNGDAWRSLYFPYMERIGILQNIGGHNTRAPDFYREAHERGLGVIIDTYAHRDPGYVRAYVEESAAWTNTFKAFNEVDIQPAVRGTPASWVAKARQDYEIIKKANPAALMLGASLVRPAADPWFEECLKLGLANYHDVWDVHCYPQNPPLLGGTMSNSPDETELGVLKVYEKLGWKNTKPFWIGETAARSGHGNDGRRWQAATSVKMAACALSRPDFQKIGFLVPWRYSRGESSYYIMDIEAGHMPAEAAYYTASALIDGFGDAAYKQLDFGPNVQAARFGPTILAWTSDGASREVTLRPETPPPFVRVDVVGRVQTLASPGPDGSVRIPVGDSPVYVLSRADYDRLTASVP
ncbi:hypothetical protein OPIT5_30170 [Opitutaceae bacterium TAV5]|nr:hypothetical protein OPIT5_30170 [Opitutaceae bacterium TAV5]